MGFHVYLAPFGGREGRKISNEDLLPDPSWRSGAATVHGALGQYRAPASPLTIPLSCRAGLYLPTPRLATLAQTVDLFPVSTQTMSPIPAHSLAAFGLFLRLPGYAEVLLKERKHAQCLLRLVLGVTDDGEGSKC